MSEHETMEFVVHGICITSVGLAGLVANVLCLLVLRRPALKRGRSQGSVNVLLTAMASIDLLLLLSSILSFGLPAITNHFNPSSGFMRTLLFLTPWIYPIAMFAQTSSVYLTVAVTVERWFAVCRPLMARTTNTTSKARKSILLVNLGSIIYNVPRFLEYRYNKTYNKDNGVVPSSLREDPVYEFVYVVVLYMLVMYVIPLLLLGILNIQIAVAIHRARVHRHSIAAIGRQEQQQHHQQRRNSSTDFLGSRRTRERREENEQQIAIMLMVVVMIFLGCSTLGMLANILDFMKLPAGTLVMVSDLMVTFNSSVNLFIYCGFGKKFRREFKKLLGLKVDTEIEQGTILRKYWRRKQATGNEMLMLTPTNHENINSYRSERRSCITRSTTVVKFETTSVFKATATDNDDDFV